MRIVVGTVGTRGDVQPCLAIARGLRRAGFDAVLATHDDFEPMARRHGVPFRPVFGSFRALVESDLGREWLESSDSPSRYLKAFEALFGPLFRGWVDEAVRVSEDADAVVFYVMATGFHVAAARRGIPAVGVAFFPWVPSGDLENPMVPRLLTLLPSMRRWSWTLPHRMMWKPFLPDHQAHRAELGLPRITQKSAPEHMFDQGLPHLHLFSDHVVPRPTDWKPWASVTGYCFLDESESFEPPADLTRFLESGPPPVYIGFGSMTGRDPQELARIAVEGARAAGQRVIVSTGWGGIGAIERADDVHVLSDAPHDWLFPRVAAVVHHGGAGTLAAGLRAGRPTVVCSFFGDQPFWGLRVQRLGVGPKPIARRQLTASALAERIRSAVTDEGIRARAAAIGEKIRRDDGVGRAVEAITRIVQ